MTATAKVISIGDAREARRRRIDASQRASLSFKAKTPTKINAKASGASSAAASSAAAAAAPAASGTTEKRAFIADFRAAQADRAAVKAENAVAKATAKAEKAAAKAAKAHTRTSVAANMRASKKPKHAVPRDAAVPATVTAVPAEASDKVSAYAAAFAAVPAAASASAAPAAASEARTSRPTRADRAAKKDPALVERAREMRESAREHRAAKRFVLRNKMNNILSRPFATGVLVFCGLMLIMGIFLYPTARTYYQAVREHDRLETEFMLVLERNEQLAEDIEFLQTDEGITREAREQLGWVERGEHAVIVYGTDNDPEADVNADIVSSSVKAPVTWYSPFLDFFFGYK